MTQRPKLLLVVASQRTLVTHDNCQELLFIEDSIRGRIPLLALAYDQGLNIALIFIQLQIAAHITAVYTTLKLRSSWFKAASPSHVSLAAPVPD